MLPHLSSGNRGFLDTTNNAFPVGEAGNDNPYRMPSDDQVFRIREEERWKHKQSRARSLSMRVWEKSKKEVLSFSERLREIVGNVMMMMIVLVVEMICHDDDSAVLVVKMIG